MTDGKVAAAIATITDELAALRAQVVELTTDSCQCTAVLASRDRRVKAERCARLDAIVTLADRCDRIAAIDALESGSDADAFWSRRSDAEIVRLIATDAPDHATQDRWLARVTRASARHLVRSSTHLPVARVRVSRARRGTVVDPGVIDVSERDADDLVALGAPEASIVSKRVWIPAVNPRAHETQKIQYGLHRMGIDSMFMWVGLAALHEMYRRLDPDYDQLVASGELAVTPLSDEDSVREQTMEDHQSGPPRTLVRKPVAPLEVA